jgi:hypothetical protein
MDMDTGLHAMHALSNNHMMRVGQWLIHGFSIASPMIFAGKLKNETSYLLK